MGSDPEERGGGPSEPGSPKPRGRIAAAGRRVNRDPRLLNVVKSLRELLPGDSRFGDRLSTAGQQEPQVVGRAVAELTSERPGVLKEAGLSALQVWEALARGKGEEGTERELAIAFTDLVEFSTWALEAGDEVALELLRDVAEAIEPPVKAHEGEVVKRLGDGMMAVFRQPGDGLAALMEARERLGRVQAPGYEPSIRAGMHFGRPREIGGDYFGVDVNVAARVAEEAGGGELLVSDSALERLDAEALRVRRKRLFRVKGVPKGVTVYSVR